MKKVTIKPVRWISNSHESLCAFSDAARSEAGTELLRVQFGGDPSDWKPMEIIGAGVREIRIREERAYRVIYVAKFAEAVYVLHAFVKKTQKTAKADIDLATKRYRNLVAERKSK